MLGIFGWCYCGGGGGGGGLQWESLNFVWLSRCGMSTRIDMHVLFFKAAVVVVLYSARSE